MSEIRRQPSAAARHLLAGAALLLGFSSEAWAAADRTAPTTPTNLRVLGVTAYTVTLAWDASQDKSGIASYTICCANTNSVEAPGNVTTFVFDKGLAPGRSFTLVVWARDRAGNWSKTHSNAVTFTLLLDTTPPSQPRLSLTGVGARHVSLLWSGTDDDPTLRYALSMNGSPVISVTRETSTILTLLRPETSYTFVVQSIDNGGHRSPPSEPLTVSTAAANPDDVTPPTAPAGLWANSWGDCEVELSWGESTDDLDPQFVIEYQVFVNDVYDHSTSLRYTRTIVYATRTGLNEFDVVAVDTAGNRSEAAVATDDLAGCFPPEGD
jgi:chitodextrinase